MCLKCGSGVHRVGTDLYSNGCLFPVRGNYWVSDLVRNEFSQRSDRHCTCPSHRGFCSALMTGCGRSAQPDLVPADASCRANQCTGGSLQVLFTCCVAPRFEVGSVRGTWGPLLKVSPDIETSGLSFPSTIDSN